MKWLSVLAFLLAGCGQAVPRVVLYCGQDEEFARDLLEGFTRETGIQVVVKADTEADKSVSLYQSLVREAAHPRCDVFWNGEILNTVRLRHKGLLQPYASPSAQPFPSWAKASDHTWHAFAARARVLIVHQRVPAHQHPKSIFDLTKPAWKGRVAMAKPHFGTTATHAACLYQILGREKAEEFLAALRPNVAILAGNKQVALAVAEGRFDVGFTDTDDAVIEVNRGQPVAILYPDQHPGGIGTLFIPNTVAVVRGGPNYAHAQRLVDYLLSPAVETQLAQGRSAQVPLNPKVAVKPPVETPATIRAMRVDYEAAAAKWDEVQTFLRQEFAQP